MENKCQYCGSETTNGIMYLPMSLIIPKFEDRIDKLGRDNWWEKLEDPNLTEEERISLDDLAFYDQMVNTLGKGYACNSCLEVEDKHYMKYHKI